MATRLLLVLALGALTGVPAHVFAAEVGAKEEFDTATRYFEAEEYLVALPHFEQAYRLSDRRPAAIFGLAQCLRLLKRYEESIRYFEEYIATEPADAERAQETVVMLRELKRIQDQSKQQSAKNAEPPPSPPPPPAKPPTIAPAPVDVVTTAPETSPEESSVLESPWFWIITGAVAIGGGIALGAALGGGGSPYGGNTGVVLEL